MTATATAPTVEAGETATTGIPPASLASIDADYPDGHPNRLWLLRNLAAYYASGGCTPARRDRVAPIIRAAGGHTTNTRAPAAMPAAGAPEQRRSA